MVGTVACHTIPRGLYIVCVVCVCVCVCMCVWCVCVVLGTLAAV